MDIRRGEEVIILSGDEKGKHGRVLAVFLKSRRVLVEKINMIKRHTKPRSQQQAQSGIVEKEAPVHISNVALYDSKSKGPTRVRHRIRFEKDGDREVKIKDRIATRSGEILEKSTKGI